MNNPFVLPNNKTKIVKAKNWILNKIKNNNLSFYDLLDKVKQSSESGDKEMCSIWCYHTANVILNSNNSDREKAETISDLNYLLENMS